MAKEGFSFERARRPADELPDQEMAAFNASARIEVEEAKRLLGEYLPHLKEMTEHWNARYVKGMREFMRTIPKKEYLVRRENPDRVLATFETGDALPIHFHGSDARYYNAALWHPPSPAGLDNAYLEGNAHKYGLVTIIGVDPRTTNLDVEANLPGTHSAVGTLTDREKVVVSVEGDVRPEEISFVLMRVASNRVPDTFLSEEELDDRDEWEDKRLQGKKPDPHFVYRGFVFGREKAPPEEAH